MVTLTAERSASDPLRVRLIGIVRSVAVAIEAAGHDMLQAVGGVIALPCPSVRFAFWLMQILLLLPTTTVSS